MRYTKSKDGVLRASLYVTLRVTRAEFKTLRFYANRRGVSVGALVQEHAPSAEHIIELEEDHRNQDEALAGRCGHQKLDEGTAPGEDDMCAYCGKVMTREDARAAEEARINEAEMWPNGRPTRVL